VRIKLCSTIVAGVRGGGGDGIYNHQIGRITGAQIVRTFIQSCKLALREYRLLECAAISQELRCFLPNARPQSHRKQRTLTFLYRNIPLCSSYCGK